jgi:hypothetical protein
MQVSLSAGVTAYHVQGSGFHLQHQKIKNDNKIRLGRLRPHSETLSQKEKNEMK